MMIKPHFYGQSKHQTIVLLHPGAALHHIWLPLIRHWEPQYRIIAFDIHPVESGQIMPLEEVATQILAYLKEEQAGKVVIIGSSIGANIALHLALLDPDLPDKLVLDSAQLGSPTPSPIIKGLLSTIGFCINLLPQSFVINGLLNQFKHLSDADVALVRNDMLQIGKFAFVEHARATLYHDVTTRASQINMPTLLIAGEQDMLTKSGETARLAQAIPSARLEMIASAGHVTFLTHSEQFLNAVDQFLSEN